ncbi:MAG: hypothetical protein JSU73_13815 [candidate division WOR-3 bacterium]|nr:MAG: hypothetical protein JSU73_13815 [candidate division WOR-3 bacterium]
MKPSALVLVAAVLAIGPAFAGDPAGEEVERIVVEQQYDLGSAKVAELELMMPVGHLEIEPGSEALVQARYEAPDSTFLPEAEYVIEDGRGRLEIGLEDVEEGLEEDLDVAWSIRLNGDAVEELNLELGVGELEIKGVWPGLKEMDVEVGVGEIEAALEGEWNSEVGEIDFELGIGDVHILLPGDIGFRVETEVGIGDVDTRDLKPVGDDKEEEDDADDADGDGEEDDDTEQAWVNELWGKAAVNVEISIEVGIGEITIATAEHE